MMNKLIQIIISSLLLAYCEAQNGTFRNPILEGQNKFPSVIKYHGYYYMAVTNRISEYSESIELLKSPILSNFRDAERHEVYRVPPTRSAIGTPRILSLQGSVYIYFSLQNETGPGDWESTRMYVIESLEPCNLLGVWSNETRLLLEEEIFAVRGTVFQNNFGELYFIWAGPIDGDHRSTIHLLITRMENPMKTAGPKAVLRSPKHAWEGRVIESPSILQSHGAIFLIFSAGSADYPEYCLGVMGIDGGRDPMLVSNWWNDVDHCVVGTDVEEEVFSPGHSSFVRSPDDTEVWMLYQARVEETGLWTHTTRIQKLDWHEMNRPKFPTVVGLGTDLKIPSGE